MKIIIVGCGRLGSGLANQLSQEGNDVTVVTANKERLAALDDRFTGQSLVGVEFDRELLLKTGVEQADSLIACTGSDDTNALVARIAKKIYKVPRVIARLYDSSKVDLYNALGIQVIATTQWGIERTKDLLTFKHFDSVLSLGNGHPTVEIVRFNVPPLLDKKKIEEVLPIHEVRLVALSRNNETFIPNKETVLHSQDVIYLAAFSDAVNQLKERFVF
ncbi:potassium channel family protein [Streptococcus troglodytae]|uniref:Trk system potassium uptake protein TrkA n=1 Tax=Streptococcus troglodytae TaxID=1111760 RepID=A0A1L7LI65_9STRE|nr:NAD-binding protein [Streptococcus troglodytae]BAQ23818.1 potassium uptake protein TrkA [Streptococcus troglodytae]